LACEAFYLHGTLRSKFVLWAELLDRLSLRGDERILDLGWDRGAVLLMAAQRLTTGRAVGVDLWRMVDQSGNSAEATQRNDIAEKVADRVECTRVTSVRTKKWLLLNDVGRLFVDAPHLKVPPKRSRTP